MNRYYNPKLLTILVFAGSFNQFIQEMERVDLEHFPLSEFVYIGQKMDLYGYEDVPILLLGEWWKSPVLKWAIENHLIDEALTRFRI